MYMLRFPAGATWRMRNGGEWLLMRAYQMHICNAKTCVCVSHF